jgi:hypothetical protein
MTDKRGFNRQEAIGYLGVKGRFFDERIRPNLSGIRMGTGVIFDRVDLDRVFEEYKACGDGQPTEKGGSTWAENSPASTGTAMATGGSTRSSAAADFRRLSAQIMRKRRNGYSDS